MRQFDNVDRETTLIGLMKYSDDYARTIGLDMMFVKDTTYHPDNRTMTIGRERNAAENEEADAVISRNGEYNLGYDARRTVKKQREILLFDYSF